MPSGFDAQVQLQFTVDAVNPLAVPAEVLHVAQVKVAQAKTLAVFVVREPHKPVGNLLVLSVELGLVAVAGLTDGKNCACQPNSHAALLNHLFGHLAPATRPCYFF